MNEDAQSALLKTLEEPPAGVVIVLCADQETRLLPTVRSRCARIRLGLVGSRDIEAIVGDHDLADPPMAARLGRLAARPARARARVRARARRRPDPGRAEPRPARPDRGRARGPPRRGPRGRSRAPSPWRRRWRRRRRTRRANASARRAARHARPPAAPRRRRRRGRDGRRRRRRGRGSRRDRPGHRAAARRPRSCIGAVGGRRAGPRPRRSPAARARSAIRSCSRSSARPRPRLDPGRHRRLPRPGRARRGAAGGQRLARSCSSTRWRWPGRAPRAA